MLAAEIDKSFRLNGNPDGRPEDAFDELLRLLQTEHRQAVARAKLLTPAEVEPNSADVLREAAGNAYGAFSTTLQSHHPHVPDLGSKEALMSRGASKNSRASWEKSKDKRHVEIRDCEPEDYVAPKSPRKSRRESRDSFASRLRLQLEEAVTLPDEPESAKYKKSKSLKSTRSMHTTQTRSSRNTRSDGAKVTFLGHTVKDMDKQRLAKQRQRFWQILFIEEGVKQSDASGFVRAKHIWRAMQKRGQNAITCEEIEAVLKELKDLDLNDMEGGGKVIKGSAENLPTPGAVFMHINEFVALICMEGIHEFVQPDLADNVALIQETLMAQDIDEIFERANLWKSVTSESAMSLRSDELEQQSKARKMRWQSTLDCIVAVAVVLSFIMLGISVDVRPDWAGWVAFEAVFTAVFVTEVIIKVRAFGCRSYLLGKECRWNWVDVVVTVASVLDLGLSMISIISGEENKLVRGLRITVVVRLLRLARMARLLKLLQNPMMRELANMLSGFFIGLPALCWVMLLLLAIIFVLALVFNQIAGNKEERIQYCGQPDLRTEDMPSSVWVPEENKHIDCRLHWLYGEEFFGDMTTSMFTIFRCMIGDCTTRSGQSLTAHLSKGYGLRFEIVYAVGMIMVVFGLFNIVTAIFVETTLSGLKHNDIQKKRFRLHEHKYVQEKIETLLRRVQALQADGTDGSMIATTSMNSYSEELLISHIRLTERQFKQIMVDARVQHILEDLDVHSLDLVGLFDLFDPEGKGYVELPRLIDTIMMVRGEPQKSDMIAAWVSLQSLTHKFQAFQVLVLKNQQWLIDQVCQIRISTEANDGDVPPSPSMSSPWRVDRAVSRRISAGTVEEHKAKVGIGGSATVDEEPSPNGDRESLGSGLGE